MLDPKAKYLKYNGCLYEVLVGSRYTDDGSIILTDIFSGIIRITIKKED